MSEKIWYHHLALTAVMLSFLLTLPVSGFAVDPLISAAQAQKNLALELFLKDAKVSAATKSLQESHYKLLSTDAIPYRFAYGDEGPISNFLVTAWFGRPENYGWSAAFVAAKVNTDSFGPSSVTIVDTKNIYKLLQQE